MKDIILKEVELCERDQQVKQFGSLVAFYFYI